MVMADTKKIGFIGLGIMGEPMARNLMKAGHKVTVFNRTRSRGDALVSEGASRAETPADAARGVEFVITIVTDTPDVESVLFAENGVVEGISGESKPTVIDMSTISPEATKGFAARLAEHGVALLDAPVSGGDIGAINGTLTIMCGGDEAAFQSAEPLFDAMGSRWTHVGPSGAGQSVKACNQVLCAINMVATCEALSLAKAMNLELDKMLQVVTGGAGNSWALEKLGTRIAKGDFDPGFMVRLIQKDLRIVMDSSNNENLALPGTSLAAELFKSAAALGCENLGTQAMMKAYERLHSADGIPSTKASP